MSLCKLPEVFVEDPHHIYPEIKRPSDEAYAAVMARAAKQAADTIIVDRKRKKIVLSYRLVYTMKDRFWNFGGSIDAREPYPEAARRTFARDAGLDLPTERFIYVRQHRVFSAIRGEIPQNAGEDCLTFQFAVHLTDEEISRLKPGAGRYSGLRGFSREDLAADRRLAPQLKFYDAVFGWRARIKRAVMRFLDWLLPED